MQLELTPVVEVCVDFGTFHNVDLVQRGYYQIRSRVKLPHKYASGARVDIQCPRTSADHLFPASIVDGQAVGSTIEIVYAEESVRLDDNINYIVHMNHRSDKLPNVLEFVLVLELWFLEKDILLKGINGGGPANVHEAFRCLSKRSVRLHVSTTRGLHWHRPVLFDYYHLAAVTLTVHASTVGMEPRWRTKNNAGSNKNITQHQRDKIILYHRSVCRTLLSIYEDVQTRIQSYSDWCPSATPVRIQMVDTLGKLDALCNRFLQSDDRWTDLLNDQKLLSDEVRVIWIQFLELFRGRSDIELILAKEHHNTRVKRFADGFFSCEETLTGLITSSFSPSSQNTTLYIKIVDLLKKSTYFSSLPALPMEVVEADGDCSSLSVIFEENYLPLTHRSSPPLPAVIVPNGNRKSSSDAGTTAAGVTKSLRSSMCLDLPTRSGRLPMATGTGDDDGGNNITLIVDGPDANLLDAEVSSIVSCSDISEVPTTIGAGVYPSVNVDQSYCSIHRSTTEPNLLAVSTRQLSTSSSLASGSFARLQLSASETRLPTAGRNHRQLMLVSATPPMQTMSTRPVAIVDGSFCCFPQCTKPIVKRDGELDDEEASETPPAVEPTDDEESGGEFVNVLSSASDEFHVRQLTPVVDMGVVEFIRYKEMFKEKMAMAGYAGHLASDFSQLASRVPYFNGSGYPSSDGGVHLIVCVHGLDGCSDDLRPYRNTLRLIIGSENIRFILSEVNQQETFNDLETMSKNLADEILGYLVQHTDDNISRISFIAHSLGALIARGALDDTRASLVKWWKKSRSLEQLMLRDQPDVSSCYLYKLSQSNALGRFKYVLLVGSADDRYVPLHSALVQPCRAAQRDTSAVGVAYAEMVANLLQAVAAGRSAAATLLVRYVVFHAPPAGVAARTQPQALLGRTPHVAVLDDDVFIEKFLLVSALRYFL